jgi:hypothetical protein
MLATGGMTPRGTLIDGGGTIMRPHWLVILGSAGLLTAACSDWATDCNHNANCTPPAGWQPPCEGQCVPEGYAGWIDPYLVWLGEGEPPMCPQQARGDYYDGIAEPAPPMCGPCACQPSTGSCAFPATMTATADQCPGTGPGMPFDPPSGWDGSCTTQDALGDGIQSVRVAALAIEEGCVPVAVSPVPKHLPKSPTVASTKRPRPPRSIHPRLPAQSIIPA